MNKTKKAKILGKNNQKISHRKPYNQLFLVGLMFIITLFLINSVNAWSTTTFNNSLTTENLSLITNQIRWLNVPTNTYLTNAYLNLTGINGFFNSSINVSDYGIGNGYGITSNGTNFFITDGVDKKVYVLDNNLNLIKSWSLNAGNTDPYGITNNGTHLIVIDSSSKKLYKYTINGVYESNITLTGATLGSPGDITMNNSNFWIINSGVAFIEYYLNGTSVSDKAIARSISGISMNGSNLFINDGTNLSKLNFDGTSIVNYSLGSYLSGSIAMELNNNLFYIIDYIGRTVYKFNQNNVFYPSDVFMTVGSSSNFIYIPSSGLYGYTNRTPNIAKNINNVTGSCTCTDCRLITGYCQVPFIFDFFGDAGGVLEYSNMNFDNLGLVENSQTYNPTSISRTSETFIINFTYDTSFYTSTSGKLNYNGVEYSGTLSGSGNTKLLTTTLTTPIANGTYPFYWNISLTNSSGINYFKSNNYTQTINPIYLRRCNDIYNTTFINFTVRDAENSSKLLPSKFKITFNYGIVSKSSNDSYTELAETNSSFPFCLLPSDLNYTIDAKIEYEATGYSKNYYYLNNVYLTNATTNITLYLLNETKTSLTVLKAQTDTQTPLSNVYISIQRYDTGTDTYYTVGMARTDYKGEDLAYLNWYDTFYKYTLVQDSQLIYIANSSRIYSSPVTFTVPSTITFDYDKFLNIAYTLTFNNATGNFILTYTIPSGTITSACLRVDKRTIKNDTLICNTCETSSSATIYCNINAYGNGTFIATFYAKGSLGFIDSLTEFIGAVNKLYDLIGNVDGTMYAILFSALCMVLFFITPVLGIVGLLLGMIGGIALGFQPVNYMEFVGIVIVGAIIIMILKR